MQLGRREYEDAWRLASEALRFDKTNTEAPLIQSAALWGLKRFREADEQLRRLVKANASSAVILFQVGSAYRDRKEFRAAEEIFRKMHQVDPADPRGLIGVKEVYMVENKPDKEIVAQQPARSTYRYHLDQAYAQKGEKQKAIQELQTALKSNPQKDEANRRRLPPRRPRIRTS